MKIFKYSYLILTILLISTMAEAQLCGKILGPLYSIEPTYGPEFTFTNEAMIQSQRQEDPGYLGEVILKTWDEIRDLLVRKCKASRCRTEISEDKHGEVIKVTYEDGWYFQIGVDINVLEVQTKPSTLFEFQLQAKRIQSDIFDMMQAKGLKPHVRLGGGHVHTSLDIFEKDPDLFMSEVIDYFNQPQVTNGALGGHPGNSPAFASLKIKQQQAFQKIVDEYYKLSWRKKSVDWIIQKIQTRVYQWTPAIDIFGITKEDLLADQDGINRHYQSLRFSDLIPTYERRGLRPQVSAQEFLLELELIQAHLIYLKSHPAKETAVFKEAPDMSPQNIVNQFYQYVTKSGLEWSRFRVLLRTHYFFEGNDINLQKISPQI